MVLPRSYVQESYATANPERMIFTLMALIRHIVIVPVQGRSNRSVAQILSPYHKERHGGTKMGYEGGI